MRRSNCQKLARPLAAALAGLLSTYSAQAADIYWDGTGTAWNTVGFWSTAAGAATPNPAAAPGAGDIATFSISTVNTAQSVNLNAAQSVLGLSFLQTNTATTLLQGGSVANQTLTLGASGISVASLAGAVTIGSTTALQNIAITLGAAQSWTNNSANALTLVNGVANGGFLLTLAGSGAINLNGVLAGSGGLTKTGTGTTTLAGRNTYTGTTTINQGTLATTRTLANTTGVTFSGSGTLNINQTTASVDVVGALTLAAGDATVQSTRSASSNEGVSFASAARTAGATGNFVYTGGTVGTSNRILLLGTSLGFVNQGVFVGGANYGYMNAANTHIRAAAYGTDATFVTSAGGGTAGTTGNHLQITGNVTAQTSISLATLKLSGARTYTLGTDQVLTLSRGGLLQAGAGSSTINASGIGGITTAGSTELVVRSDLATDFLTLAAPILSTSTGGLTKSGAGTLTLSSAGNAYSGATTLPGGTLALSGGGILPSGSAVKLTGNSGVFSISAITGSTATIGSLAGVNGSSVVLGAKTLSAGGDNTSTTFAGVLSGTGALSKSGSGVLTLSGVNTFSGALSVQNGTLSIASINNASTTGVLGNSASAVSLGNSGSVTGTLSYTGATTSSSKPFTLATGGTGGFEPTTSGQTLTLSGVIAGSGNLAKTGAGTLLLSAANTYTGATNVSAGTLKAGVASVAGTSGAFGLNSAISLADINGAGIDVTGFNTQIGSLTGGGTTGGSVTLGAATLSVGGDNTNPAAYAGVISGTGALTKIGSGTQILSAANSYTGLTTVSTGVLNIQNASALGTIDAGTSIASGAALQLQGGISVGAEALTLNGSGVAAGGALRNISGDNAFGGLLTLAGPTRINSDAGVLTLTHAGTITGTGAGYGLTVGGSGDTTIVSIIGTGTGTLTKDGSGVLTLAGASTFSGATTISGGTLRLDADERLSASTSITLAAGATFDLNGHTQTIASISGVAGSTVALGANAASSLNLTLGSGTFAGTITGAGELQKTGAGTLALTGANTFEGDLHVLEGTLSINAVATLATAQPLGMGAAGELFLGSAGKSATLIYTGDGSGKLGQNINAAAGSTCVIQNDGSGALDIHGTITNGADSLTLFANNSDIVVSSAINGSSVTVSGSESHTVTLEGGYLSATIYLNVESKLTLGGAGGMINQTIGRLTGSSLGSVANASPTGISALDVNTPSGYTDTFSGVLGGSGDYNNNLALTKDGVGTLVLSGTAANTYSGLTHVSLGGLQLNKTGVNAIGGDITVDGGALTLMASNQIADTSNVVIGSGSLAFDGSGKTETVLTFTNNGGTFTTGANTLIGTGSTITWTGGSNTINSGGLTQDSHYLISGGTNSVEAGGTLEVLSGGSGLELGGINSPTLTLNSDATTAGRLLLGDNLVVNSTLTDGTAQILSGGSAALPGSIDLSGGTRTLTINDDLHATDLLIAAAISNGGLIKAGAGSLVLSGTNTYAGGTTLSAGTLTIGAAAAVGSGTLTFSGGVLHISSTLSLGNAIVVNDASHGVSVDGGQTLTLSGSISGSSGLHKDGAGFLVMAASSNTAPTIINAGTATGTAANADSSLTVTNDSTFNFTQSTAGTYSGEISGAGKVAVSGPLTLSGTNTSFSGNIEIGSTATLAVATKDSLGSSAITLDGSAESASVLQFTGASSNNENGGNTYANNITVSANQGVLHNTGTGTVTLGGSISKNGSVLILQGGTFDITGTISGASANSDLVVDNSTTTLSGTNTYSGPTYIINGGTLNANSALPTDPRSAVIMDATGTGSSNLTLGTNQQIASLTGTSTSTVALGANTLTIGTSSGSTTFAGVISGSGGALVKDGASIQILSGANTYTGGTAVDAGTLVINGDQHLATGAVSVSATLAGTGTVGGATTINSGATHAPGAVSAVGTQNFSGDLHYADGSIFEWDLTASGANMAGMGYDMVGAGGAISVDTGNTVFMVVFGAGVNMSDDFWSSPWVTHTWAMSSIFGKAFFAGAFQTVQTSYPVNSLGSFTIKEPRKNNLDKQVKIS